MAVPNLSLEHLPGPDRRRPGPGVASSNAAGARITIRIWLPASSGLQLGMR
jgi:hypothetical protein